MRKGHEVLNKEIWITIVVPSCRAAPHRRPTE